MIHENSLEVKKTARFYTIGTWNEKIEEVWYFLHGYRQLGKYFAKSLEALQSEKRMLVFPEALNKFYIEGYSGKIGATWMTKEDRENEISDYVAYLNQLHSEIAKKSSSKVRVGLLGFSQGGATAIRWACAGKVSFDKIILWASTLPTDLQLPKDTEVLSQSNLIVVYGDKDEFANEELIQKQLSFLKENDIKHTFHNFDGKHEIKVELLGKIMDNRF